MILAISGIILVFIGLAVSILFWIPAVFDRSRLKTAMGRRYLLVYVVYVANGPMLVLIGLLLIFWLKVR